MLKTQKVCWWRRGPANTEGKLGKEPDGEMGSQENCGVDSYSTEYKSLFQISSRAQFGAVRTYRRTSQCCCESRQKT